MVHVGTGKIERRPYAVIDGCDNVLRYECEREREREQDRQCKTDRQ